MSEHKYIQEAYKRVCKETVEPVSFWLTLYCDYPFYGGPEEGGWWGSDTRLIETKHFRWEEKAEQTKALVQAEADDLNKLAKKAFGDRCTHELEWLDARGLDADYLPEPDGEEHYWVIVEEERGEHERTGDRYYS